MLVPLALAAAAVMGVSSVLEADRQAALERRSLQATGAVLASTASEAVVARDRSAAFRALRSIAQLSEITYARIETGEGVVLAETGAGARLVRDAQLDGGSGAAFWTLLLSRSIETSAPVLHGKQAVGRVVLLSKTDGLLSGLAGAFAATALGVALAALAGLAVAWRMQQRIAGPVLGLTRAMAAVRDTHDFDQTAAVESDDEIGDLVDGFNAMLGEIRTRDRALAEHLEGLEQTVADRTAELRVAKDAADSANTAKSEFLASMSHEIRTPMNGIMVMAEMLAASEIPPKQRRYADVIAKSGQSLLSIINDILDFSKIESGKMDLESIPVDLAEIAEDVTSLFWEKARGKGLDLASFVHPAVPAKVLGDPVRLRQILSNLVNNAVKFTDRGGVLIKIEPADADAATLTISVQDTGVGIPKEKLATLFEAFTQVDQSTTRKYGGTGLGLAICKKLVDAMGGRLSVKSAPGKGSNFHFTAPFEAVEAASAWPAPALPDAAWLTVEGVSTRYALNRYLHLAGVAFEEPDLLTKGGLVLTSTAEIETGLRGRAVICLADYGDDRPASLAAEGAVHAVMVQPFRRAELRALLEAVRDGRALADVQALAGAAKAESLPRFETARVLVADDSAVNREVALEALSRLGVKADTADDGRQALEAARRGRYDLILMDGSMPEMDGFESSRAIRAHEAAERLDRAPIVALTAHVVGAAAEAWRDAGMDGVLYKPFTLAQLAETLGRFLTPTGYSAAEPAPETGPAQAVGGEPASNDPPLLDPKIRADLAKMSGDGGFLAKIEGLYRSNAPNSAAAIAAAVQSGDAAALSRAAHALKSMSFNLGAARVASLCGELESSARAGAVDAPLAARVAEALQATLAALAGGSEPVSPAALAAQSPSEPVDPLEAPLRAAIAEDRLELVYQAQYDRTGREVVGAEALVRWRGPDGPVSPAVFIPLAERAGMISDLTDRVMARLCLECADLPISVAFNASALEVAKPDFVERVRRQLAAADYPAKRLEVEITETAVLDEGEQVDINIAALRAMGCKVALDDFGAGYTSLRHLRRYPFDKLKIDRDFIVDCGESSESATIVHAVCSIGRALGMKVVAEGVETEKQRDFLKVAGAHALQGYLFAKPEPIAALKARLAGAAGVRAA